MPADVIPVWDHIWGTVAELHRFWRFHVDLCGNAQHVALMQEILLGPLVLIRKAVLSHITMGVGRLLDRPKYGKRANLSFAHLLESIQPYTPPDFAAKMATMLDDAAAHCEPLLLWRDKRFGHADKAHVLGTGAERLPEVEQEAFEKALAMLRDLLAEIHAHFNGRGSMHFPEPSRDADNLMKYVREGYKAEQARIAELFP
jgi:hypothetical protein